MEYTGIKRNASQKVESLLAYFPVVVVLGIRQCGKTTLARMVRNEWDYYDLERQRDFDFITRDFDFFFKEHPGNVIIDEAQISDTLFRELRSVVDRDRQRKNRFLLIGSSSPFLLGKVSETLAGRVGVVSLSPLKMNERYQKPLSNIYDIWCTLPAAEQLVALKGLGVGLGHNQVMAHFLSGGFPEPVLAQDQTFFELWMQNYVDAYIQRDLRQLFPGINTVNFRRFIQMLAELTGTIINRAELGRSLNISEMTVRDYLDIAEGTFIWRNIRGFEKSKSKSLVKMPRGYMRDSGLLHHLLNIRTRRELVQHHRVGVAFEAFIIEEILAGLEAKNETVAYHFFRTRNGAEVDLVLERGNDIIPIEIKFGLSTSRQQLKALTQFVEREGCEYGVLINNSDSVMMLTERIIQIPAALV